jgi:hypothetical protein
MIDWEYGEAWMTNLDGTRLELYQAYYDCFDQALKRFLRAS